MEEEVPQEVNEVVYRAVALLADKDFGELEKWSAGQYLSAKDMQDALAMYETDVVLPPRSNQLSETYFYESSSHSHWFSVDTTLWSVNGPTDVTLQLEVLDNGAGENLLRIKGIRIL